MVGAEATEVEGTKIPIVGGEIARCLGCIHRQPLAKEILHAGSTRLFDGPAFKDKIRLRVIHRAGQIHIRTLERLHPVARDLVGVEHRRGTGPHQVGLELGDIEGLAHGLAGEREILARAHHHIRDMEGLVAVGRGNQEVGASLQGGKVILAILVRFHRLANLTDGHGQAGRRSTVTPTQRTTHRSYGADRRCGGATHRGDHKLAPAIAAGPESRASQQTRDRVLRLELADDFVGPDLLQIFSGENHLHGGLRGESHQRRRSRLGLDFEFHGRGKAYNGQIREGEGEN